VQGNFGSVIGGIILSVACVMALTWRIKTDGPKGSIEEERKRLASVRHGSAAEEVMRILGKPDEIRTFPQDRLLDGTRKVSFNDEPETERWAYGVLAKGMFARIGYVSMDHNRKVLCATPSDWFAYPNVKLPKLVGAKTNQAVETASNMTCLVGPIKHIPADGETAQAFKTKVTLKNSGTASFELQNDAASNWPMLLLVEVYDSAGQLLFRDEWFHYTSLRYDDANRPVLSIGAGKEESENRYFSPGHGFGALPPGKYSVRMYFPFEERRYYPSNLVRFEVK
jgi:hypothetical protein